MKRALGHIAVVFGLALACPALADSSVAITLQDPSSGGGIPGMQMQVNPPSVPAGPVTFHATNESKNLIHEVIVVRVRSFDQKLPYNRKTSEVIEKKIKDLGEIADLKPGASGTLSLNLKPGDYLLLCNQPGHYAQGMQARFTVSR